MTRHPSSPPTPSRGAIPRAGVAGLKVAADIEPLLRIGDLARILNCSRRAVERLRAAGKLPAPDLHLGRSPRWRAATVAAWIESRGCL